MAIIKTILFSLLSVSTLIDGSFALPDPKPGLIQPRAASTSPILRKEWSAATAAEQPRTVHQCGQLPGHKAV
jgi:hypothetical protein